MALNVKRLVDLLEENNLNQRELAKKIEVTEVTISRYISGDRQPTSEIISKMADALNTSSDYLLGRTDIRNEIYSKNNDKVIEIKNPLIRAIARKGDKLSDTDALRLKKAYEALFPDAFDDENT